MQSFWDYNVWSTIVILAILFGSLLVGNFIKKSIPALNRSLIPTSVIGGLLILIVAEIYKWISGHEMFGETVFMGSGANVLEVITYHALALGFIASTLKTTQGKMGKKRTGEIINTGITTVSSYLMQGALGLFITIIAAKVVKGFFAGAGVLLPFGYGQGTGQAMNYGSLFEKDYGFLGGTSFGLAVAAMGFLSAAIGGVIHLNIAKKRGNLKISQKYENSVDINQIQGDNEIPMQESIDKVTMQLALIFLAYILTYIVMWALGTLAPGMRSLIYGFNFLIGVLMAVLIKAVINGLMKKGVIKREYRNNFLLTRCSNFFYDIMVVAGIAAISLDAIKGYWGILLILGIAGLVVTFIYNRFVARKLFPDYEEEQFLVMFGMLTGTASTGIILLREVDGDFATPASENLVYQNFPAIVLGFPMMLIATFAAKAPLITALVCLAYMAVLQIVLFRSYIFKKKK